MEAQKTLYMESKPMEPPAEPEAGELPTRRIHIMGMGSIGTLIAHSLKILPNAPPITLCMHKEEAFRKFKYQGSTIRLIDPKTDINDEQTGFNVEVQQQLEDANSDPNVRWEYDPYGKDGVRSAGPANPLTDAEKLPNGEVYIYCLILTVKALNTAGALQSVRHRLNAKSTVCLMQNGLGQIDEVIDKVFTDPSTRPTFLIGVISHGCYMNGPSTVVHAGFGVTSLGIHRDVSFYPLPSQELRDTPKPALSESDRRTYYPTDEELYSSLSSRYLLRTLTRSPVLACAAYPHLDLLQLQLEKLSSNALLNPLTSIFDIPNGTTLSVQPLNTIQNLLVSEISLVIRSLPELQGIPGINQRFSASRLKELFVSVARKTAANSSSMREDIRRKRVGTEINYINGYIVKRGEEVGIKAALNFMILEMVKAKNLIANHEDGDIVPWGASRVEGTVDGGKLGDVVSTQEGENGLVKDDWERVGEEKEGVVMLDDVGAKAKEET